MIVSPDVARKALLLVNTPDAYSGLQDVVDYILDRNRTALETMEASPQLYRLQGEIALLRKLKYLREEVIHRAEEK